MSEQKRTPLLSQRFRIPVFFLLAYLFAWTVWGTTIAHQHGWTQFAFPAPEVTGLFGSSVAALIVGALSGGWAEVKAIAARMTRLRMPFCCYATALLLPVGLSLTAVGVEGVLGGHPPVGVGLPLAMAPLYFLTQIFVHLLSEETGWRGFALPHLQERFSPLVSSVILGVLWACWHIPLFFMPGRPQAQWPFLGFVALVTATTVIMTWIQNRAGTSFVSVLFHAAMNTAVSALGTYTGGRRMFWVATVLWILTAVLITYRNENGSR